MSALSRLLFPNPPAVRDTGTIFRWWESRRLTYNAIVGATGLVTLLAVNVMFLLPPRSMNVEIFWPAIIAYGVFANLCYSFGFIAEAAMQRVWRDDTPRVGPALFRQGLIFSVGLTLFPAALAGIAWGFRLLRWLIG